MIRVGYIPGKRGLIAYFDTTIAESYSGGSTWNNLIQSEPSFGTLTGSSYVDYNGISCLDFNGTNTVVNLSSEITTAQSVCMWMYVRGSSSYASIINNWGENFYINGQDQMSTILGPELIINGDFSNGPTDWVSEPINFFNQCWIDDSGDPDAIDPYYINVPQDNLTDDKIIYQNVNTTHNTLYYGSAYIENREAGKQYDIGQDIIHFTYADNATLTNTLSNFNVFLPTSKPTRIFYFVFMPENISYNQFTIGLNGTNNTLSSNIYNVSLKKVTVPVQGNWVHICTTNPDGFLQKTSQFGKATWKDHYFNGLLSSIKMYNRILSPDEIKWIFRDEKTKYGL